MSFLCLGSRNPAQPGEELVEKWYRNILPEGLDLDPEIFCEWDVFLEYYCWLLLSWTIAKRKGFITCQLNSQGRKWPQRSHHSEFSLRRSIGMKVTVQVQSLPMNEYTGNSTGKWDWWDSIIVTWRSISELVGSITGWKWRPDGWVSREPVYNRRLSYTLRISCSRRPKYLFVTAGELCPNNSIKSITDSAE